MAGEKSVVLSWGKLSPAQTLTIAPTISRGAGAGQLRGLGAGAGQPDLARQHSAPSGAGSWFGGQTKPKQGPATTTDSTASSSLVTRTSVKTTPAPATPPAAAAAPEVSEAEARSTARAGERLPDHFGRFIWTERWSCGRPVYVNDKRKFMFWDFARINIYRPGAWYVGEEVTQNICNTSQKIFVRYLPSDAESIQNVHRYI